MSESDRIKEAQRLGYLDIYESVSGRVMGHLPHGEWKDLSAICSGPQQLGRCGLYSPRPPMSPSRAQWLQDRLDMLPNQLRVGRDELSEAMREWLAKVED